MLQSCPMCGQTVPTPSIMISISGSPWEAKQALQEYKPLAVARYVGYWSDYNSCLYTVDDSPQAQSSLAEWAQTQESPPLSERVQAGERWPGMLLAYESPGVAKKGGA